MGGGHHPRHEQAASHQVVLHNSLGAALERFQPDVRAEYERIVRRGNPWDDEQAVSRDTPEGENVTDAELAARYGGTITPGRGEETP